MKEKTLAYARDRPSVPTVATELGIKGWTLQRWFQNERLAGERVMYVFVNRKRDMAKVLWRDATGWCLLAKRLDESEVVLPDDIPAGASSLTIGARALAVLLDGAVPRRRKTLLEPQETQ